MAKEKQTEVVDKAQEIHDKQLEVLDQQLKALTKPDQNAEFMKRSAEYDAKKPEREKLAREISDRRLELMRRFDWLKIDEVSIIEANIRRSKEIRDKSPADADKLLLNAKLKIEQLCPNQGFKVNHKDL